jgi:hypothetical protein
MAFSVLRRQVRVVITLSTDDVAKLQRLLTDAEDFEHSTAEERADVRIRLCGVLSYLLDEQ